MDDIQIKRSTPEDTKRLTALGLESKAHWGYDQEILKLWKPMFEITEEGIATHSIWSVRKGDEIIDFFSVVRDEKLLGDFLLAPEYIA